MRRRVVTLARASCMASFSRWLCSMSRSATVVGAFSIAARTMPASDFLMWRRTGLPSMSSIAQYTAVHWPRLV